MGRDEKNNAFHEPVQETEEDGKKQSTKENEEIKETSKASLPE